MPGVDKAQDRFTTYNYREMSESWNAIVVGAGLGGLTAAARLVKEGLRVLVVEQDPHPGGTAYAYQRKGFSFPMGPLGFSNPDLVQDILLKVGVNEHLDLKRVYYQLRAFGLKAPLSLPFPEMIDKLTSIFPDEEKGIKRFFDNMEKTPHFLQGPHEVDSGAADELMAVSASDYLDGLVDDWKLRRILGSMGTREPYSGLPLIAAMWHLLCEKGIHYPPAGMRHLCDILAEPLAGTQGLGELMLSTRVSEITLKNDRACGVVLSDGARLEAEAVISNADYKATFLHLVHPSALPEEFLRAVSEARQTMSNLQVCLGLDASRVDLSTFVKGSRLIYRREGAVCPGDGPEPAWGEKEVDPSDLAGEELEVTLISADDPSLAPRGGAVLVIRVAADYNHFTRFRPERGKRSPDYLDYKNRLGEALVNEASKLVPGLEDAVLVMDVATPLTFEERGGRSGGAVAGWSWDYGEGSGELARELIRTPVKSLYMAGYQAYSILSLGGIPTAMKSGLISAQYLLEGKGPISEALIPY
jgi:all-trans-retinol 13,14-reductase